MPVLYAAALSCMPHPLFCNLPRDRSDRRESQISWRFAPDHGIKSSRSRRIAVKARWHYATHHGSVRGTELAYKMIAERDNETVKIERTSTFIIVAKARIGRAKAGRSSSPTPTANRISLRNSISCWRLERI